MSGDLRSVDLNGLLPVHAGDQVWPVLQWVKISDMVIDDRYQRPLGPKSRKAIQSIAGNFDGKLFTPVIIAPVDGGKFAIIDGQHRVHAAALCGFDLVPCSIVLATTAEQAKAFAGINGQVSPITAHQVYRAALEAQEPLALQCRDVVASAGCELATVNPSSKDRKPRVVYQIGSIRAMVGRRGMSRALNKVLRSMVDYDTKDRVPLYTDYIVKPCVEAIHGDADFMAMDLVAFFQKNDPYKILRRAEMDRLGGEKRTNTQAIRIALGRFMVPA